MSSRSMGRAALPRVIMRSLKGRDTIAVRLDRLWFWPIIGRHSAGASDSPGYGSGAAQAGRGRASTSSYTGRAMANVLITGGAGTSAGWLTDRAAEAGHDVRVYDLLLYEDRYLKDVPVRRGRHPRPRPPAPAPRLGRHGRVAGRARRRPGLRARPVADAQDQPRVARLAVRRLRRPDRVPVDLLGLRRAGRGARRGQPHGPLSLYAEAKLEAEAMLLRAGPTRSSCASPRSPAWATRTRASA